MHRERLGPLTVLHEPWRAVAARAPQAAPFPTGFGIIDTPVEALCVKPHRIRHGQQDHLAVLHRDQTVLQIGGGHRHVFAEPKGVVLIDPGVVARLRAVVADALKARARILVE